MVLADPISVHLLTAHYRLDQGQHPSFFSRGLHTKLATATPTQVAALADNHLPLDMCRNGHTVMSDAAAGVPCNAIPLTPLFVKDLAGRIIYTGLGPEIKEEEDWQLDWALTFPRGCQDVTAEVPGAALLESIFFLTFRTLDYSTAPLTIAAAPDTPVWASYPGHNLYPYKLRLDTFYQDGWRLPQTQLLYARPSTPNTASHAADFLHRWENRGKGQRYEAFFEANGGDAWFEDLFLQGCTIIPTFEACNGYNKIDRHYNFTDFWPGRAVPGLHDITAQRPDPAPVGTILEVLRPGYLTADEIIPAQVVVSDGQIFAQQPMPAQLYPDVRLPHERTCADWGACWLPTAPEHFQAPALWGWDGPTGRFLQLSGPLWDPLHYPYSCRAEILRAYRRAGPLDTVPVPEGMKRRFYPVEIPDWVDTLSAPTAQTRQDLGSRIQSAIDTVPQGIPVCTLGYHPLPRLYDFSQDPFWSQDLRPDCRDIPDCPAELAPHLAPIITLTLPVASYTHLTKTTSGTGWWANPEFIQTPSQPEENYPFLYATNYPPEHIPFTITTQPEAEIQRHIRRAMGPAKLKVLDALIPGLSQLAYDFAEQSLWYRRLRYRLLDKYPGWYARLQQHGLTPSDVAGLSKQHPDEFPRPEHLPARAGSGTVS